APVLRDPPRRLDLAGVCSMASEGAAISGRSSWDWLIQGFFPSPAATAEQWYGEVAEDGSGLRISVRPDGRVALDYFGGVEFGNANRLRRVVEGKLIHEGLHQNEPTIAN
ncbi:hypothetical protein AB1L30_00405, partial [Bremerella sp. JC817]|uniref:hypothetical protein n=1 Tax=Bremerella sp. JC817 TaxID=3231756 RepID=UPI0034575356